MVAFYNDLEKIKEPDWTGASKEPSPKKADTSMETLLSGLGDLAGGAARMADQTITAKIGEDARKQIDPIRDDLTKTLETANAGSTAIADDPNNPSATSEDGAGGGGGGEDDLAPPTTPLPTPAQNQLNTLARTKAAVDAGAHPSSDYYTKLNAVVSQLRSQYPGYADQIDASVSKITGVIPANALLRSRLAEYNASQRAVASADNKVRTEYHTDSGYLQQLDPKGVSYDKYKANRDQYQILIGQMKAKDQAYKSEELALDANTKTDAASARSGEKLFTSFAGRHVQTFVNGAMADLKAEGDAITAKGTKANPEEVQAYNMKVTEAINQIKLNLVTKANEQRPLADGKMAPSYATRVGMDKVNKIADEAVQPLKDLAAMYSQDNKNGIANLAGNVAKNREHQAVVQLTTQFPGLNTIGAMRSIAGNEGASLVLQKSNSLLDQVARAANTTAVTGVATAKPGEVPTIDKIAQNLPEGKRGAQTKLLLEQFVELAKNEDPKVAANAVEALYKDKRFFAELPAAQQATVFQMLAHPNFTEKMKALGGEAFQQYSSWVEGAATTVGKTAIDTLQKDMVEFNRFETTFHPDAFQFSGTPRPGAQGAPSINADPRKYAAQSLAPINRLAKQLQPVLEAQYGADAPQKFMELLGSKGLDMGAEKKGTVSEELGKSIFKTLKGVLPTPSSNTDQPIPGYSTKPGKGTAVEGKAKFSIIDDTVMDIAKKYSGLDENKDTKVIASFIKNGMGKSIDPSKTPWCAGYVNAVLGTAGKEGTGSLAALSFLNHGKATTKPAEGDIVVLSRGGKNSGQGHVGFYAGTVDHDGEKYIKVLGGNQGRLGAVSEQEFPASRVRGFRKVSATEMQQYAEAEGIDPVENVA